MESIFKSVLRPGGKISYARLGGVSLVSLLVVAASVNAVVRRPEITSAMRGKQVAVSMGCFGCHGPEGFGGSPDPISPGGRAPGWEQGMASLYIRSESEIDEWILHGEVESEKDRRLSLGAENLVPMPAYSEVLSSSELADLKSYFVAVAEYYPDMPDEAYEGSVVAKRLGCFGCHGPSGMGGMENPKSFTGIIPSWDGEHFDELVRDDDELKEWILDGKVQRIMEHPVGRYFIERQIIQMPGYKEHLSAGELNKLIIYIKWLRGHEAKNREADNPIA